MDDSERQTMGVADVVASAPKKLAQMGPAALAQWVRANVGKFGVKSTQLDWTGLIPWLHRQPADKFRISDAVEYAKEHDARVMSLMFFDERLSQANLNAVLQPFGVSGEFDQFSESFDYFDADGDLLDFGDLPLGAQNAVNALSSCGGELARFGQYRVGSGDDYGEMLLVMPRTSDAQPRFVGYHWFGVENVVAHVRFTACKDCAGRDTLYVQEIQSDWGQTGRREGFSASSMSHSLVKGGVPVAPFVTETGQWVGLAVERVLAYAAQNGYECVAFIDGASAHGLFEPKAVFSQVSYRVCDEGGYELAGLGRESGEQFKVSCSAAQLVDYVGKGLAEKVEGSIGRQCDGWFVLEGADLDICNKGMTSFYDQLVPAVVQGVLRHVGGGGAERIELPQVGKQFGLVVTDAMRERFRAPEVSDAIGGSALRDRG